MLLLAIGMSLSACAPDQQKPPEVTVTITVTPRTTTLTAMANGTEVGSTSVPNDTAIGTPKSTCTMTFTLPATSTPTPTPTPGISEYGVEFTENWPFAQKSATVSAIKDVGGKLASLRGGTAIEAFLNAYQGVSIIFIWGANGYTGGYNLGNCQGYDTGGCTVGSSGRIVFFSFLSTDFQ